VSSALIYPEARGALRAKLLTVTGLPAQAWEGKAYQPTNGTPFVEDTLSVIGATPRAVGSIEHTMLYVLSLKYPANKGTADIEAMAGKILDAFKVGTKLTYGSSTVLCYKAERRGSIVQEPEWQILTVAVTVWAATAE
jgi:hypothetical protein